MRTTRSVTRRQQEDAEKARNTAMIRSLPQEVVDLICRSLLRPDTKDVPLSELGSWDTYRALPDLCNARFINHAFDQGAASLIFVEVKCTQISRDLEKVSALSNSRLAGQVRKLTIHVEGWRPGRLNFDKVRDKMLTNLPLALAGLTNLGKLILFEGLDPGEFSCTEDWISILSQVHCKRLTKLVISSRDILGAFSRVVTRLGTDGLHTLSKNLASIQKLNCSFWTLSPAQYIGHWALFSQYFSGLKSLFLRRLMMDQGLLSAQQCQQTLAHMKNLTELRMESPRITSEGLISMIRCSKETLRTLHLTGVCQGTPNWRDVLIILKNESRQLILFSFDSLVARGDPAARRCRLSCGRWPTSNFLSDGDVAALKELAEQIDNNRTVVDLKPMFHPLRFYDENEYNEALVQQLGLRTIMP